MIENKPIVECTGKHLLINVKLTDGQEFDCIVSDDCKNIFRCDPEPESITEIEDIIRDAAWNLEIKNLNELG